MGWHMNPLRRPIILHRTLRRTVSVILCLVVLCGIAGAQLRRQQKTPRAIALVEWPAKGNPVVVPITILIDGHFHDASIYMADPVPMALEGGTVYEVQQSGDPVGFATIDGVMNANGAWTAVAKYQTKAALAAAERKQAPSVLPDIEEGPPKLHKGGNKPPDKTPNTPPPVETKPQPSSKPEDEGRPTLRKPEEAPKATAPNPPAVSEAKPPPDAEPDADQSGRPRLRRGKPVQANVESAPAPTGARTATTSMTVRGKETQNASPVRVLPAISDAGGAESRSFVMPGSETTPPKVRTGMEDLARAALQKFAASHGGARLGRLEKVEIRGFDLSLTNQATVVLTASAHVAPAEAVAARRSASRRQTPPPPPVPAASDLTFWVTIVARENYNGELRQLQAWTTDSKHLDAYPRMELIDALDADGDGRGELLFRAVNDLGRSFVISRVTADQVVALYDSGELAH